MKLLSVLLRYSPGALVVAVVVALVSGAGNALLLVLVNRKLTAAGSPLWLLGPFVALLLLAPLARVLASFLMIRLSQRAVHDLRMDLSRRILASPLRRLEEVATPRLNAVMTQDINSIANALVGVPSLFMNLALLAGALVYLGHLSWRMLLALLVLMALGIATYMAPLAVARRRHALSREKTDRIFDHYRGVLQGTKELKLHAGRRRDFLAMLDSSGMAVQKLNVSVVTIYSAALSWGQMLFFFVVGMLLFVVPLELRGVTSQALIGYVLVILYLMAPLESLLGSIPDLMQAEVALRKTESLGLSLVEGGAERLTEAPQLPPTDGWHSIELAGVTHRYVGENADEGFTLGPLDLGLRRGELLFVTGGNGSGKTTLAKLLVGLYVPESGEVRRDGKPVGAEGLESYRQLFSVVFSDFYLFESLLGLIADDLDERARDYLVKLRLEGKLAVRGGEFSTLDLSQGQRKRLALLTACLEDRPIYLFDEWAADQDPMFKSIFYLELLPELKAQGKTIIVISHDDHFYFVADRLIKLDGGALVQPQIEDAAARPASAAT